MKYHANRQPLLTVILGLLFMAGPTVVFAQSTLIPCGFDLNGDKQVKDANPPMLQSSPHEECYFNDVVTIAQNVINWLIFKLAMPLAAIMFAYAGFLYVTNQGNEGQVKQAHDIFTNVFIGLVIALAAWITVNFVLQFFLGANSKFNFLS
jgi:hypothetical protein